MEETIRYPLTLNELYLDTKAPSKRYTAAVAACQNRTECHISVESAQLFEESVMASMDELPKHSIQPEDYTFLRITNDIICSSVIDHFCVNNSVYNDIQCM